MESKNVIVRKILERASFDWVMASDIEGFALSLAGANDLVEARDLALPAIRYLLDSGYVTAGSLREGGFLDWGCSPEMAFKRIESSWHDLHGELVEFGAICWLQITPKGMVATEALK